MMTLKPAVTTGFCSIGGQPDHWFVAAQPVPARLMLGQRVPA